MCLRCCAVVMEEATACGQGFAFSELMEDLMRRPDVSVTLIAAIWRRENLEMELGNRRWN